jgi:hypothetical protein
LLKAKSPTKVHRRCPKRINQRLNFKVGYSRAADRSLGIENIEGGVKSLMVAEGSNICEGNACTRSGPQRKNGAHLEVPMGAVRSVVGGSRGGFLEWAVKGGVEKCGGWSFEGGQT